MVICSRILHRETWVIEVREPLVALEVTEIVQRLAKKYANLAKQDPGRARQSR